MRIKQIIFALAAGAPIVMFAFSTGPPVRRTGAAVDGGVNCSVCHATFAPANSDTRGSVAISVVNYTPGVKQTITVSVKHPEAMRWGFQISARLASDPSKQAGTFATNTLVRVRCDTTPAQDAPCNGAVEFPEHNNAPRTDAGAGFTFSIDWTPPSGDAGDVMFYAAGNAANGDGNFTGDRIYTTSSRISVNAASVCSSTAVPSITGVVNAASYQTALSAGSLVSIFGKNFSTATTGRAANAGDIRSNSFPTQLGCVAVEIDGQRSPVVYVQSDQINAQVPATTKTGPVTVRVLTNPDLPGQVASANATATLQTASCGLFTFNGKSAAALFGGTANAVANPAVVAGGQPAKPGDMITLFGTGFGVTNPVIQPGVIATDQATVTAPLTVMIGGTALAASDVTYVGLSPGSISGLYQINARLPATLPDGDATIVIQEGSVSSQTGVTIPIKK